MITVTISTTNDKTPVDERKDVEHCRHVRMIVTSGLFEVLKRLLAQRDRHLVAAL